MHLDTSIVVDVIYSDYVLLKKIKIKKFQFQEKTKKRIDISEADFLIISPGVDYYKSLKTKIHTNIK